MMAELVARTGRLQQRYEHGYRLIAGSVHFPIFPFFFCDLLLFEGKCQFQLGTLFIYVCIKKCTFFIVNLRFDWLMLWYFLKKKFGCELFKL